jgi:hypothetical protein
MSSSTWKMTQLALLLVRKGFLVLHLASLDVGRRSTATCHSCQQVTVQTVGFRTSVLEGCSFCACTLLEPQ